ncbi:MAG: tyrosine-type recombinase/integrase [Planctomycetia bacterium]|nr:tyrosine-type recombinase/integrase [Planctomycetia bacterium]
MDIAYDMTLRDIVEKHGIDALDLKVADVAVLAEARRRRRADGLQDTMTLTEFYEKAYKPEVSDAKDLKPDTLRQRKRALLLWKEFTGDPPLCDITKSTLVTFVQRAKVARSETSGEALAPATVRKHCAALQSVLDYAGPKTEKNREAKELIPMPPRFPTVRVFLNPTAKTPAPHEVAAVVKACSCAEYPKLPNISPKEWWECAYKMLALTGMRRGDLLGLRWGDIRAFRWGWAFAIPADVEKTGKEKIVPISRAAKEVLDKMPRGAPDEKIFRFEHSASTFARTRKRIVEAAGVLSFRGTWHAMRRFVATVVQDAQLVLGHTSAAVTSRHYQSMARAAVALEELGKEVQFGEV